MATLAFNELTPFLSQPFRKKNSPFHDGGRDHIETSPLICSTNQWTGFYMMTASVMKGLIIINIIVSPICDVKYDFRFFLTLLYECF